MTTARTFRRRGRALIAGIALGTAGLGLASPAAQASTTPTVPCTPRQTAQKFLGIDNDSNYYFTAPSGTFENGTTGWTLSGASVVSGNERRFVNGLTDFRSLKVSTGGSATSPLFCNKFGERSIRFFYTGQLGARLHVHLDVTNSATDNRTTAEWETTVTQLGWTTAKGIMVPDLYSAGYENIQVTLTAPTGSVQVDDIEIDPFKSL